MTAAVFLLSAVVLAHEICLLRVLSIAWWHHAAALVVSVALLGFGVAGTLLALLPRLKREGTVAVCAALYALLVPLGLRAASLVDFNVLEVGWDPWQWGRLLAVEAIFLVPFLVAATGIQAALAVRASRPGGIYGANLLGSGAGALLVPPLLRLGPPEIVLVGVAVAAAAAGLFHRRARPLCIAAALAAVPLRSEGLPMSPFKDLAAAAGKKVLWTRHSPQGRVDLAEVPSLHDAPGLALTAPLLPGPQRGIYLDGHLAAARDREGSGYLAHTVGELPFLLLEPRTTLLLGVGPDLARATEVVEGVADVLRAAEVPGTVAEPRAFLEGAGGRWDLVLHHVPTLSPAAETPLLTVEGLAAAFARTTERGGLALGCPLTAPPRPGLRLLATAERVTPHLVAVRTADRLSVVLLHRPPDARDRERVLAFCHENGFDPVRPVAWRLDEPYHVTDTPLDPPGPAYPYDVRPATDARPYFFKSFRWSRIGDLFDPEATSFVEWPYVALLVALVQVTLLGLLLMAGPLAVSRAARAPAPVFLALGTGFMLLEMGFLQRAMVTVGSPVHAAAAVIGGFLVGSGCGSLAGERLGRPLARAALAVVLLAPLGYLLLPRSPVPAALVAAAVSFPMGMPFPAALSRLREASVPWALAWNGCASVAAAAVAPLLSSTLSIPATCGGALLCYLAAAALGRPRVSA